MVGGTMACALGKLTSGLHFQYTVLRAVLFFFGGGDAFLLRAQLSYDLPFTVAEVQTQVECYCYLSLISLSHLASNIRKNRACTH